MSTGLEHYDPWKCTPPFNPDEREAEEPCEACEREVESLTAELGQRDARLEAIEIENIALRQHSEMSRLVEAVGKRAPGSYSVQIKHHRFMTEFGVLNGVEAQIAWWPTENGDAHIITASTATEALAKFEAAWKETQS